MYKNTSSTIVKSHHGDLKTLEEQKAELARSSIVLSEARSLLGMLQGKEASELVFGGSTHRDPEDSRGEGNTAMDVGTLRKRPSLYTLDHFATLRSKSIANGAVVGGATSSSSSTAAALRTVEEAGNVTCLTEAILQSRAQMTSEEVKFEVRSKMKGKDGANTNNSNTGKEGIIGSKGMRGKGVYFSAPTPALNGNGGGLAASVKTIDATKVYEMCLDGLSLGDLGVRINASSQSIQLQSPASSSSTAKGIATGSSSSSSSGSSGAVFSPLMCYTSLRKLTANFNNLTSDVLSPVIVKSLFGALKELRELSLEFNQIEKDTFIVPLADACQKLETLSLRENKLCSIAPFTVAAFPKLASLDLSYNNLSAFAGSKLRLPCLTSLDLSHNQLTSIEAAVATFTRLVSLDVSHNLLTSLKGVEGLVQLEELYASNNALKYHPAIAHSNPLRTVGRGKLAQIDLSSNRIASLAFFPPPSCDNLKNVWYVNLSSNTFWRGCGDADESGGSAVSTAATGGGRPSTGRSVANAALSDKNSIPTEDVDDATYGEDELAGNNKSKTKPPSSSGTGRAPLRGPATHKRTAPAVEESKAVRRLGGVGGTNKPSTPPPPPALLSSVSRSSGNGGRPTSVRGLVVGMTDSEGLVPPSPEAPSSFLQRLANLFPSAEVIDLSDNGSGRIVGGYSDLVQLNKLSNLTELSLAGTLDETAAEDVLNLPPIVAARLSSTSSVTAEDGLNRSGRAATTPIPSAHPPSSSLLSAQMSVKERHRAAVLAYLPRLTVLDKVPIAGTALTAHLLKLEDVDTSDTVDNIMQQICQGGAGEGGGDPAMEATSSRPATATRSRPSTSTAGGGRPPTSSGIKASSAVLRDDMPRESARLNAIEAAKAREELEQTREALEDFVAYAEVSKAKCLALAAHMKRTMDWSLEASRVRNELERRQLAAMANKAKTQTVSGDGDKSYSNMNGVVVASTEALAVEIDDSLLPPAPPEPDLEAIEKQFYARELFSSSPLVDAHNSDQRHQALIAESMALQKSVLLGNDKNSVGAGRIGGVGTAFTLSDRPQLASGAGTVSSRESEEKLRRRMGGDSSSDEEDCNEKNEKVDARNSERVASPPSSSLLVNNDAAGNATPQRPAPIGSSSSARDHGAKDPSPRAKMLLQQDEQRRKRHGNGEAGDGNLVGSAASKPRPSSVGAPITGPGSSAARSLAPPTLGKLSAQDQQQRLVQSAQSARSLSSTNTANSNGATTTTIKLKMASSVSSLSSPMLTTGGLGFGPLGLKKDTGSLFAAGPPPKRSGSSTTKVTNGATVTSDAGRQRLPTTAAMAKVKAQHNNLRPMPMSEVQKALETETDAKRRELLELMGAMAEAEAKGEGEGDAEKRGGAKQFGAVAITSSPEGGRTEVDRRTSTAFRSHSSGNTQQKKSFAGNEPKTLTTVAVVAVRRPSSALTLGGPKVDCGVGTDDANGSRGDGGDDTDLRRAVTSSSARGSLFYMSTSAQRTSTGTGTVDMNEFSTVSFDNNRAASASSSTAHTMQVDAGHTKIASGREGVKTGGAQIASYDSAAFDDDELGMEVEMEGEEAATAPKGNCVLAGVPSIANMAFATALRTGVTDGESGVQQQEGSGQEEEASVVPYFEKESRIVASGADPRFSNTKDTSLATAPLSEGTAEATNTTGDRGMDEKWTRRLSTFAKNTSEKRHSNANAHGSAATTNNTASAAAASLVLTSNSFETAAVSNAFAAPIDAEKRKANRMALLSQQQKPAEEGSIIDGSGNGKIAAAIQLGVPTTSEEGQRGATAVCAAAKSRSDLLAHLNESNALESPPHTSESQSHPAAVTEELKVSHESSILSSRRRNGSSLAAEDGVDVSNEPPTFFKTNANLALSSAAPKVVVKKTQGGSLNARRR